MSSIEKKLRASLRFDAINGDRFERSVCGSQMLEAANYIRELEAQLHEIRSARGECTDGAMVSVDFVRQIIDQALPIWDCAGIDEEKHHCELTLLNERHRARSELFSRIDGVAK